jgi:hypothetical protein
VRRLHGPHAENAEASERDAQRTSAVHGEVHVLRRQANHHLADAEERQERQASTSGPKCGSGVPGTALLDRCANPEWREAHMRTNVRNRHSWRRDDDRPSGRPGPSNQVRPGRFGIMDAPGVGLWRSWERV